MSDQEVALARRLLPGLKTDAAILIKHWPSESGTLPFLGKYWAEPTDTEFFFLAVDLNLLGGPMVELWATGEQWTPGPCIWKGESGVVRFDIDTVGVKAEYHPLGTTPVTFVTTVHSRDRNPEQLEHVLEKYVQLEPHWFVAWYSLRDVEISD